MNFGYLNGWNKLIFLFLGIAILFLINYFLNLDSLLSFKKHNPTTNSYSNQIIPSVTIQPTNSPTPTGNLIPTITNSPTPTIIKSIQRIRSNNFENDN
jgi:hypothetical protein